MAGLGGGGDLWKVTPEERAKHDAQFMQLKPINGMITGEQAKSFFLQSGLQPQVLGQIWGLADMNADGKMDKKEFSIAMFLIKKKLEGYEIPKVLPPSMKVDMAPGMGSFGVTPPMNRASFPSAAGTSPASRPSSVPGFGVPASSGRMPNGGPLMSTGYGGIPGATTGIAAPPANPNRAPTAVTIGEWAIPHPLKLKYNQMFNMHDRSRKGFLTGLEARAILTQTGLTHNVLAQVWNLSDVDGDGKLTTEEFCLSMHLVDMVRVGQTLPTKLPPDLVPPSMRRGKLAQGVAPPGPTPAAAAMPSQPSVVPPPPAQTTAKEHIPSGMQQRDAFGDLLGGIGFRASPTPAPMEEPVVEDVPLQPVTFEDRRKANFDKGQAELERRRQMLQEEQKRMEEERLAKEREEHEKRERIRMEQERKRQAELERQLAKQRELEQKREEERRKALEQREAARRELERQRQMEWERQRKEQLIAERQREQNQVETLQADFGKMKQDLQALDNKKQDMLSKINLARNNVKEFTTAIEQMRTDRDGKVSDMDGYQQQMQELNQRLAQLQAEKQQLQSQKQLHSNSVGDTYKTVMMSYDSKKINIQKLKTQLSQIEKDTASRLAQIDTNNTQLSDLNNKINDLQMQTNQMTSQMTQKQQEWKKEKNRQEQGGSPMVKQESLSSKPVENGVSSAFDAFGGLETNSTGDKTKNSFGAGFGDGAFSGSAAVNWGSSSVPTSSTSTTTTTSTTVSTTSENGLSQPQKADPWASTFGGSSTTGSSSDAFASLLTIDWGATSQPVKASNDIWGSSATSGATDLSAGTSWKPTPGSKKHRALYQFEARNADEITLKPGDIVWVKVDQTGAEEGWCAGEMEGNSGFFPQAYVEPMADDGAASPPTQLTSSAISTALSQPSSQPVPPDNSSAISEPPQPGPTSLTTSGGLLTSSDQSSFTAVATAPSPTPGQGKAAPEGLQAVALYPWRAKKDNHLTFDKGDVIILKEQQDMWWLGELNGQVGWFPKSYVKQQSPKSSTAPEPPVEEAAAAPISAPVPERMTEKPADQTAEPTDGTSSPEQPEYFVAMYNYQSSEPGDLSFTQGEVIGVIKKDGDWWTGTVNGRTGIFPANYVKQMEIQEVPAASKSASLPSQGSSSLLQVPDARAESNSRGSSPTGFKSAQKGGKKPEIATVIAPYQATGQEQLTLHPGQLIQIRKRSPSGWWEGELQARGQKRRIGWFPANYVKVLASSARSTPDAQRSSMTASPSKSLSPTPQPADEGSRSSTPAVPQPTTAPAVEQVVALFPYQAQHADELSFHKGSIINVLNKDDDSWLKGECNGSTGLFPANYVQPLSEAPTTPDTPNTTSWSADASVIASTSPTERKRQHHIHELIQTEEMYMKDMITVREVFYQPLSQVLSPDELETIFVNWNDLIICNTKLLQSFRVRRKITGEGQIITMIGDILCENLPHMAPYIRFCSVQLSAATFIQRKDESDNRFRETCRKCQLDRRTSGMPVTAFLLKPMQRITRYPLLIGKVLEYTPAEHPDRQYLQEAEAKAAEICSQVNEGVRETENTDKLEWIQKHVICDSLPEKLIFNSVTNCLGPRKFIYSGTLYKAKSGKELVGFLFNDFLLLTQPQKSLGNAASVFSFDIKANTNFKLYKTPIFLNEILTPVKASADEAENQIFHLSHIDKVYSLKAISTAERDTWVKKIAAASKNYLETERKKKEKAHTARNELHSASIGRLLVVVVEGAELQPDPTDGKSDPYCDVSMGAQEHRTKVINNTLNPKWNASMQFTIKDLNQDVLCITVYDRDLFTPNDFLGRTEIRIKDIYKESREKKGPITKRLLLHEVASGEVVVKLDIQLYEPS